MPSKPLQAILLALASGPVLLSACGAHPHRPDLPPPEYEEPAPPTPFPSSTGSATPPPAPAASH